MKYYLLLVSAYLIFNCFAQSDSLTFEFIRKFDQYKSECYADSTARYHYTICDVGCWEVPCDPEEDKDCPKNWEHREPTFIDFMNWLKEIGSINRI